MTKTHFSKMTNHGGITRTGTLCNRMTQHGDIECTTNPAEVTCKICRRTLPAPPEPGAEPEAATFDLPPLAGDEYPYAVGYVTSGMRQIFEALDKLSGGKRRAEIAEIRKIRDQLAALPGQLQNSLEQRRLEERR